MDKFREPEQFDAEVEIHGGEPFAVWAPAVNGSHVKAEHYFALLAELEAKDKRIAELEAKLATPVRLPALLQPERDAVNGMIFANGRNEAIAECSVAIRQAGFLSEASPMTVEGDE